MTQPAPIKSPALEGNGLFTRPWIRFFQDLVGKITLTVEGIFITESGRIKNVTVVTADTTLDEKNHVVKVDTDTAGGDVNITLPAIVNGTEYWIFNVGSSGYKVNITGSGFSEFLVDDEDLELIGDTTTGVWN